MNRITPASDGVPRTLGRLVTLWEWDAGWRRSVRNPDRPGPLLTEDASEEYGQGIRCLLHLPSAYSGRGGKRGKGPLGIPAGCQVKGPARKIGGESLCPDKIPLPTRFRRPHRQSALRNGAAHDSGGPPDHPQRNRSPWKHLLPLPGGPSKDHAIQYGPPPHPTLSKKRTLRPGLGITPSPLRLINC